MKTIANFVAVVCSKLILPLACTWALAATVAPAHAVIIGGVDFPQGAISFADTVISYNPAFGGGNVPVARASDPNKALGDPNHVAGTCTNVANCNFVSLGAGGRIILRFVDNVLTGSGNNAPDLWIFEIGEQVEDTFVDISTDGTNWFSVGKVTGSTSGVDIDAFGFGANSQFFFVRLTDDINLDGQTGETVGADIDAVGAISTRSTGVSVPEPMSFFLLALGLLAGYRLIQKEQR